MRTRTKQNAIYYFSFFTYKRFRSEEHTSELQSQSNLVCRLLLEKKNRLNYFLVPMDQDGGYLGSHSVSVFVPLPLPTSSALGFVQKSLLPIYARLSRHTLVRADC